MELAQLEYMLPRLTRQWSHLERQAGGIGTRGVGETQLEIDRRIVRNRISQLKGELEKIERTRETQRKSRSAAFTVALVGYTNAGKSTLFNQLTGGKALAVDKLFATLDAKSQRAAFPMPRQTVIIDTVGFVRKLPHHLVASFRSTLEEAADADLLMQVVDASSSALEDHLKTTRDTLESLGLIDRPVLPVFNKIDRVPPVTIARLRADHPGAVFTSALDPSHAGPLAVRVRASLADGLRTHPGRPAPERVALAGGREIA